MCIINTVTKKTSTQTLLALGLDRKDRDALLDEVGDRAMGDLVTGDLFTGDRRAASFGGPLDNLEAGEPALAFEGEAELLGDPALSLVLRGFRPGSRGIAMQTHGSHQQQAKGCFDFLHSVTKTKNQQKYPNPEYSDLDFHKKENGGVHTKCVFHGKGFVCSTEKFFKQRSKRKVKPKQQQQWKSKIGQQFLR